MEESAAKKEYTAFEEKVRRTVYLDSLSPLVTESVIRTALDQFGSVTNVHFIPNYTEPKNTAQCALVEMDNEKQATEVIKTIATHPFMMSGMPRPVRARVAKVAMFDDRPVKPGRKITCRWLNTDDPDFEVAQKLKRLTRKHAAEASFLLKLQLEEEEKLAKQQMEALKANYKKFEMIENVIIDGTANCLADRYGMKFSDD